MSNSYQAQIALRFEVRPHEDVISKSEWEKLDKTPENVLPLIWFAETPETELGDDFYCRLTDGRVFIDYVFMDATDCYNINFDIPSGLFEKVAAEFARKFVVAEDLKSARENHPIIVGEKVKVLYFHNRHCNGLLEVV